ncbi:hypothetical protein T4D_15143 [Trichinella pseudospiralis]|uniref:Uncharacterized protein n=1 Tax=Trichinella pseudospiralis TaxID=6337 RepID=A0A0V1G2W9_TRIPS|nr:hypothetical protein T4D_15143 [Trichinella pseudospiralis]
MRKLFEYEEEEEEEEEEEKSLFPPVVMIYIYKPAVSIEQEKRASLEPERDDPNLSQQFSSPNAWTKSWSSQK